MRGLSDLYMDNARTTERMIVTPIRKITDETISRTQPRRRLILSQV